MNQETKKKLAMIPDGYRGWAVLLLVCLVLVFGMHADSPREVVENLAVATLVWMGFLFIVFVSRLDTQERCQR